MINILLVCTAGMSTSMLVKKMEEAAAIVGYISMTYFGYSINDLILENIQKPLLGLSQGLFSVLLVAFLIQLFWFFGLHGPNVLAPIMDGVYLPALLATGGNILAGLVSLFNLFVSFAIWTPFVLLANRVKTVDQEDIV